MDTNKRRDAIDENESIAQGLEQFLKKELGAGEPVRQEPVRQEAAAPSPVKKAPVKPAAAAKPAAQKPAVKTETKPAAQKPVAKAQPKAAVRPAAKIKEEDLFDEDVFEEEESFDSDYYEDEDDEYVVRRRRVYDDDPRDYEDDYEDDYEEDYEDDYEEDARGGGRHKRARKKPAKASRSKRSSRSGKKPAKHSSAKKPDRKAAAKKKKAGKRVDEKAEKKQKRKRRFLLFILLVVGILAIAMLLLNMMVGSAYNKMTYEADAELAEEPLIEEGVINVLLIGNDSRENGGDGRSDAMILLSVDQKGKKIFMTSFLRDMYVEIPGHGQNRLNAAYAYGGASLLCKTIKQNFDIEVNRYAIVNFQAFAALVDAVGGVDIEVTNEEVEWINAYLNEYNLLEGREMTTDYLDPSLSGVVHLNGPQALAYCRNRYVGTDFGRTERQRKVLSAIKSKAPVALATNASGLMDGIFPYLTTNLTKAEVSKLSVKAGGMAVYETQSLTIPADGTWSNANIDGKAVLQVDFEANKSLLKKEIYGED